MKFASVAAILSALSLATPTSAFTTPRTQITTNIAVGNTYRSYNTYLKESTLGEENVEDTAVVEETTQAEQQQAPAQPPVAVAVESSIPATTPRTTATTTKITAERIERATKERPYPLFLAEKAASILPSFGSDTYYPTNSQKEHIIVLGTGWGAASFLKSIDCNKYDVTVISPRNYFVFTPMLAGASVGTVEFRSITEPVREVRERELVLTMICCSF